IPDIVMNELLVPAQPTCVRIECDERVTIEPSTVVAATPIVVGAVSLDFLDGEEHQPSCFVDGEHAPHAWRAVAFGTPVQPCHAIRVTGLRLGVTRPPVCSGDYVEGFDGGAFTWL